MSQLIATIESYAGVYNHPDVQTAATGMSVIATIVIPEYYGGLCRVMVVGGEDAGMGNAYTHVFYFRFRKDTVLSLGSIIDTVAAEDDFGTVGIAIVNVSENVEVQVTPGTASAINWRVKTELLNVYGGNV